MKTVLLPCLAALLLLVAVPVLRAGTEMVDPRPAAPEPGNVPDVVYYPVPIYVPAPPPYAYYGVPYYGRPAYGPGPIYYSTPYGYYGGYGRHGYYPGVYFGFHGHR